MIYWLICPLCSTVHVLDIFLHLLCNCLYSDLGFSSGKAKSLYGKQGHLGVTLVKFVGDQSGLKEATRLGEFFEKDKHGRRGWAGVQNVVSNKAAENNPSLVRVDKNTGEKERILFGYLATVSDFDKIDQDTKTRVEIVSKRDY